MRKRRKFKSICCLFILALLLLSACGAAETAKETAGGSTPPAVSNAHEDAELEYAYFSEALRPFDEGFDVCGAARLDGERLAVLGTDADSAKLLILSYAPGESGRPEFSELASTQPETPAIDDTHRLNVFLTLGGDGYLYLLAVAQSTIWENNAYAESGAVTRLSKEGEVLDTMALPQNLSGIHMNGLVVTETGELIISGRRVLCTMAWEDTEARQLLKADGKMSMFYGLSLIDGGVGINTLFTWHVYDPETGGFTDHELAIDDEGQGEFYAEGGVQGLSGEFIANTGESFLELDPVTGEKTELLQFTRASESEIIASCRLTEQVYAMCYAESDILSVVGMELVPVTEASIVNVAAVGYTDTGFIREFDIQSREYELNIQTYGADELNRFQTDLISGNSPDLIVFTGSSGLNVYSDYYDDLYSYIDADGTLSRESFIPNLLDALTVSGRLNVLWSAVGVNTISADKSAVGDGYGLLPADYERIVAESGGRYEAVFDSFMGGENLLGFVTQVGLSACVDRDAGTCSFDSEFFRELLAWCGSMGGGSTQGLDASKCLLLYEPVTTAERFEAVAEYYGDTRTYVGFPDGADGCSYYSAASPCVAIPAQSQNKEGAWAYISWLLSQERQEQLTTGLPVLSAALEWQLADSSEVAQELASSLLENTRYAETGADAELAEIVRSAGREYLAGGSLDSAVENIQNRAQLYMSERYG